MVFLVWLCVGFSYRFIFSPRVFVSLSMIFPTMSRHLALLSFSLSLSVLFTLPPSTRCDEPIYQVTANSKIKTRHTGSQLRAAFSSTRSGTGLKLPSGDKYTTLILLILL
ncbi:GSCOCG00002649001-RA-CDS [Cotesia congregata]|uniref:Uncharacterized protein n=1 Tax=Cotesia congregata TaxID=51543 RepID=A0A8J2HM48_COTCN|nr:GSCOCG00002649001-RA-CDS [Cotesia congregata]CAG5101752.1 Protein of unknown function [Cotesia congregata]